MTYFSDLPEHTNPRHKECVYFENGICKFTGRPVNPEDIACARFIPRTKRVADSAEQGIIESSSPISQADRSVWQVYSVTGSPFVRRARGRIGRRGHRRRRGRH